MIRSQFWYAISLALLGVMFLVIFVIAGPSRLPGVLVLLPPASGIFLLWYSRRQIAGVIRRNHGIEVEQRAVTEARKQLGKYGFAVSVGVPTRFGDVDLLVGYDNQQVPVEIKSFESWGGGANDRCAAALAQVNRLRVHLKARRSYIWLPEARVGFWRSRFGTNEGSTTVVYGSARRLARIVRRQEG